MLPDTDWVDDRDEYDWDGARCSKAVRFLPALVRCDKQMVEAVSGVAVGVSATITGINATRRTVDATERRCANAAGPVE